MDAKRPNMGARMPGHGRQGSDNGRVRGRHGRGFPFAPGSRIIGP